jgi:hypothetical protein
MCVCVCLFVVCAAHNLLNVLHIAGVTVLEPTLDPVFGWIASLVPKAITPNQITGAHSVCFRTCTTSIHTFSIYMH